VITGSESARIDLTDATKEAGTVTEVLRGETSDEMTVAVVTGLRDASVEGIYSTTDVAGVVVIVMDTVVDGVGETEGKRSNGKRARVLRRRRRSRRPI